MRDVMHWPMGSPQSLELSEAAFPRFQEICMNVMYHATVLSSIDTMYK